VNHGVYPENGGYRYRCGWGHWVFVNEVVFNKNGAMCCPRHKSKLKKKQYGSEVRSMVRRLEKRKEAKAP
jgi:hypothetical protein